MELSLGSQIYCDTNCRFVNTTPFETAEIWLSSLGILTI
jgi:hypothetical protein